MDVSRGSIAVVVPVGPRRRLAPVEGPQRARARRRILAVVVALLAVLIPVSAVPVVNEWWFFQFGEAPAPVTDVVVVKSGTWDGTRWELVAYRSGTDGICFSMGPATSAETTGAGGAMSCDQIEGVPRTPESKPYTPHAISFLSASGSGGELPAYVAGPVTGRADEVAVYFANGVVLQTPTFEAPSSLGPIRFYAAQLPDAVARLAVPLDYGWIEKLVGLDGDGRIVACLTFPLPEAGMPLSACAD